MHTALEQTPVSCTFLSRLRLFFLKLFLHIVHKVVCVPREHIQSENLLWVTWFAFCICIEFQEGERPPCVRGRMHIMFQLCSRVFPWTSQGESEWRTGRPYSTTIVQWWKEWKPEHHKRKGCFTTEMKCHKLLSAPTVCSEDKLFSEAQSFGNFCHNFHFGHHPWHD